MKKQMVRDTNKSPLGKSGQPHRGIALNGLARMLLIFLCIADIGLGAENAATSIVLFTRPPAPYPEALDIVSLTKQSVAFAQIVRPNGAREEIPAGGIVAIIEYPPPQPDGATAQRAATALTQIDAALAKFPRAQFPQIDAKLVPLAAKWRSAQQLAAAAAIRLAATPVRPPPAIQGLTITTTDGQQFDGVTSTKVEGEILSFEHSAGVASVPLAKLTPELQRKFNYDPKVIEAAKAAKIAAEGLTDKPPYDFSLGHAPFGLEFEEVMALLKRMPGINPSKIFTVPPIFDPWHNASDLEKILPKRLCQKGLYEYTGLQRDTSAAFAFHPQLVKAVATTPKTEAQVPIGGAKVNCALYFQKDLQNGRYKLFAYSNTFVGGGRTYKTPSEADYQRYLTAFSAVKEGMTKAIGKEPSVFKTKSEDEGKMLDATGALWDSPANIDFLVATTSVVSMGVNGEYLGGRWTTGSISKKGVEGYLSSLGKVEAPTPEEFDELVARFMAETTGDSLDEILALIKKAQGVRALKVDDPSAGKRFEIVGSIIQKLPEGLLVKCMGGGSYPDGREIAQGVVLLVGHPNYSDLFPSENVSVFVNCSSAGSFEYTTTKGARSIIRRLKYESEVKH